MANKLHTFVVLLCCLLVSSCKKDESNPAGISTVESNNTFTGQIDNWRGGSDKIIRLNYGTTTNDTSLGSSPITSDGKFSVKLGIPPDSILVSITQGLPTGINVSDSTAKTGSKIEFFPVLQFDTSTSTYRNAGHVVRGSSTTITWFAYANKNVTVTGSTSGRTFNISFVKGWNMYTISLSNGSFSSIEPSDTKWIYDP